MSLILSIINVLWYASTFALVCGAALGIIWALFTGVIQGMYIEEDKQ